MNGAQYVILEWNQAGGGPKIAVDHLHDNLDDAKDLVAILTREANTNGRRERYTVHELDMEETDT